MSVTTIMRSKRMMLRDHTAPAHALLDGAMSGLELSRLPDYIRFLAIQYIARLPVEEYLRTYLPPGSRPPEMTTLIADDLERLGVTLRVTDERFEPEGDPLGVAYVIAGSHFGNRVLLASLGNVRLPRAFLADRATTAYWKSFAAELDAVPMHQFGKLALAADACFAHFLSVATATKARAA